MKKMLVVGLLVGCSSSGDSPFIDGFDPPAPADDEIQIISPAVRDIAPGADLTLCSYIDDRVTEDTDITAYRGFQSSLGGHHVILYAVAQQQAANTHECTEDDMLNSRYLAAGGADAPPVTMMPEGVVFRMPANTQLMVQTHWINATDKTIDGQGAFNLKITKPKPEHKTAQLFTVVSTLFEVPVGPGGKTSSECTVNEPMNIFMMGAHMHEWGTHASIFHTPAAGAGSTMIYDTDWSEEDVFAPKLNYYIDQPFKLAVGDKLKVDCTYNNTTGAVLPFPSEMCVAFSYGFPMTKQIDCTDGNWPN